MKALCQLQAAVDLLGELMQEAPEKRPRAQTLAAASDSCPMPRLRPSSGNILKHPWYAPQNPTTRSETQCWASMQAGANENTVHAQPPKANGQVSRACLWQSENRTKHGREMMMHLGGSTVRASLSRAYISCSDCF